LPKNLATLIGIFDLLKIKVIENNLTEEQHLQKKMFPESQLKEILELSIFSNAPFAVEFLESILDIKKSQNAPFQVNFLTMIKL